ncbi:MAG: transcriptional regulator [Tistrella sp.]|nr:transcriptional regulator [Tistrella sp.]
MSTETGVRAVARKFHEERVIAALRAHGTLSRSELARRVGLSRTTLSEVAARLLQTGAIVVADTDAATRVGSGRPAERLALDPRSGQFLGVDFGHRRVQVAVADASHEIVAQGVETYAETTTWDERLLLAFDLIDRLGAREGLHFGALQAIGIGVPGPYTTHAGMPAVTWRSQVAPDGIGSGFEARFKTPVVVDNNTRLAALAEALHRPDAVQNLVYLRLSDGVGGGLVVAGRLVAGSRGYAGELGHVTSDPSGLPCRCGKRGCLETLASVPAILAACRAAGAPVETLADLSASAATGDPVVESILRNVGTAVGRVLGATAMTLNPREVVIGGEIVRIAPVIVEQAATTLRYDLHSIPSDRPQIVRAAHLTDIGGAVGALAAVFHQSPLLAGYQPADDSDHAKQLRRSTR